jgi:hypothetical protein
MLAPKAQYSLKDAKRYFKEHLGVGDYYADCCTRIMHGGGNGFRQNPPRKIQMMSNGESHISTM